MIVDFYNNKVMREEVKEYIENFFISEAVEKVFKRENVTYIADAKELLERAFGQMEVDFSPKKVIKQENGAR